MRTIITTLLLLAIGGAAIMMFAPVQAAPVVDRPVAVTQRAVTALPAADAEALAFMREEEKLARDVYLALADTWSLPIFSRIAASEQTHMDAVKTLLERYNVADPAAATAPGVFVNPDLQLLYTQLVARGAGSLADALAVGAAIEEIDIGDLRERTTSTLPSDIARVFTQLRQGSENHLRAFAGQWEAQTGELYTPQYLDAASYQSIVGVDNTAGNGQRGMRRGRP